VVESDIADRLLALERRNRTLGIGLICCSLVAVVALGAAIRALTPVLRVQSASALPSTLWRHLRVSKLSRRRLRKLRPTSLSA
jgi:hypothetical protein